MSLKIFYNGTQWRAFEAPEKSETWHDEEAALSEAAKNSLPVLNEEVAVFQPKGLNPDTKEFYFHTHLGMKDFQVKIGEYYDWPGGAYIRGLNHEGKTFEGDGVCASEGYVLTPPAPVKDSEEVQAIYAANQALDRANADPDDDLRTVSRQYLRAIERLEASRKENEQLKKEIQQLQLIIKVYGKPNH
jgi:hypothetical protein